jgi:hypothetical protein
MMQLDMMTSFDGAKRAETLRRRLELLERQERMREDPRLYDENEEEFAEEPSAAGPAGRMSYHRFRQSIVLPPHSSEIAVKRDYLASRMPELADCVQDIPDCHVIIMTEMLDRALAALTPVQDNVEKLTKQISEAQKRTVRNAQIIAMRRDNVAKYKERLARLKAEHEQRMTNEKDMLKKERVNLQHQRGRHEAAVAALEQSKEQTHQLRDTIRRQQGRTPS